ncbi:MAG: TrpB-like pyridoxal phosphate-dependent enzyme [bacterium]|nr:MAG: TrpB-like pyridoxal phosphate-dependent enzyme [bacterium]
MNTSQIITLPIDDIPTEWYNIVPDLPEPLPPAKDPEEGPSLKELLPKMYTQTSLDLDKSTESWIKIPQEVLDIYIQIGRPRPLYRARRLEKQLETPARIYYKREDLAPTGSFKMNTTIAQAYFAAQEGYKRLAVETGAGQTGTAFAYSAKVFGLACTIYFVRYAYNLKPDRATFMKMFGAEVLPSPTNRTAIGKKYYDQDPNHPGSIGIATAESLEDARNRDDTVATVGSAKNHVLLTQTIIGLETEKQFDSIGEIPDVMISCLGGGGNFYGLIAPYLRDRIKGELPNIRFLAAESEAAPRATRGEYRYDYTEPSKTTPLAKVYTLGVDTPLKNIRAEGIRSSSTAPILSMMLDKGIIESVAYPSDETAVFDAARTFLQTEGFIIAPESAYGVKAAIDEAIDAKQKNEERVIVVNLSGMGYLDFRGYSEVLNDLA